MAIKFGSTLEHPTIYECDHDMLYLFGFAVTAMYGCLATLAGFCIVLGLNAAGVIALNPRVASLGTTIPAVLSLVFLSRMCGDFHPPGDSASTVFQYFCLAGAVTGALVSAGCLFIWATNFGLHHSTEAIFAPRNLMFLGVVAALCAGSLVLPGRAQQRRNTRNQQFQLARDSGDVEMVRRLLSEGYGQNDLLWAIERQDVAMMELFLKSASQPPINPWLRMPDVLNTQNDRLLERYLALVDDRQAAINHGLRSAVISGDQRRFERMIEMGADATYENSITCLMFAADYNRLAMAELLLQNGANVNAIHKHNGTALTHALEKKHIEMTRLLLEAGADVNLATRHGDSPLQIACRRNSLPLVQLLLKHDADPNRTNRDGWNCLHTAYDRADINEGIVAALIQAGVDAGAIDDRGRTPRDFK